MNHDHRVERIRAQRARQRADSVITIHQLPKPHSWKACFWNFQAFGRTPTDALEELLSQIIEATILDYEIQKANP